MALNLATLFARLGHQAAGLNEENTAVGATLTARVNTVFADYTSADQDEVDGIYSQRDVARSSFDQIKQYWQTLSTNTLIDMIVDGTVYNPTDLVSALGYLRLEMLAQSATLDDPSTSLTLTAGSGNTGNGTGSASGNFAPYNVQNDYLLQETITLTCSSDGYPGGGATQGQEVFSYLGEAQQPNLAWNWPAGSNAAGTLTVSDPAVDDILTNGSFDTWPSATAAPTDWTLGVGTFGTTIVRSATSYRGTYALSFVGNGSELTEIKQEITLAPNSVYCFQVQMRSDGAVAAGIITFSLVDANGTVINDEFGGAMTLTVTCASDLTSSYAAKKIYFFSPGVLPTQVFLRIKASTAITNTEVILMDDIGFTLADQLYTGGPYLKLFAGSTPFAVGDTFALAITNDRTAATFVSYLDNIWDLRTNGILIPSSNAPTISNALIT